MIALRHSGVKQVVSQWHKTGKRIEEIRKEFVHESWTLPSNKDKSKLETIKHLIPHFINNLDNHSTILAAKKAGFIWQDYRNALLNIEEIKEKINKKAGK